MNTSRPRLLSVAAVLGLSLAAAVFAVPDFVGAAPVVCPSRSQGDHAFRTADIGECIWVNNDHNLLPAAGGMIDYNIYCPGRIPVTDDTVGSAIVGGAMIKNQAGNAVNPILSQHAARSMRAVYIDTPHVFHYGCVIGSSSCVATHIKVRVRADALSTTPWVNNCKAFGSQNGDIALNARMDREYRCSAPNMFHASHRGSFVRQVAADLLRKEDTARARALGGKVCLLPETDIQCAPCTFSDKLIVRVKTVSAGSACPTGSQEVR